MNDTAFMEWPCYAIQLPFFPVHVTVFFFCDWNAFECPPTHFRVLAVRQIERLAPSRTWPTGLIPHPKSPEKPHCAFYLYQFKFDFRSPFRFHSRRLHFALMRFVCRTRRTSIAACFLNDFIMKSPLRWLIVVKLKYL